MPQFYVKNQTVRNTIKPNQWKAYLLYHDVDSVEQLC